MKKWRAGKGGRGKGGCKGTRIKRVVDERTFRGVTLWDWLQGLGLWGSMIGSDTGACGIGLGWDSIRRCCPAPGTMTN